MGHGAMQTVKLPLCNHPGPGWIVQSYDRQAESEMWKACYSSADLKRKQQSTGTVVDGFTRLNKICHLSNLGNSRIAKRTSNLGGSHCLPHVCTNMMFSKFGSIAWEHDEHRCDITFKGGIAVWSIPYIFPTAGVFAEFLRWLIILGLWNRQPDIAIAYTQKIHDHIHEMAIDTSMFPEMTQTNMVVACWWWFKPTRWCPPSDVNVGL